MVDGSRQSTTALFAALLKLKKHSAGKSFGATFIWKITVDHDWLEAA